MKIQLHQVLGVEELTPDTFVVHIDRQQFNFKPGQYVVLRDPKTGEGREYSIYSAEQENRLSFLIREIANGEFSRYLKQLETESSVIL